MRILSIVLLLCAGIFFRPVSTFAQPKQNSPYSRYGIGDPVSQYFAYQAGMGGQTAAFHDPFHLNLVNPASYAFLRASTFDVGLDAKLSDYQSATDQRTGWTGNLRYLALGFPLRSPVNEVLDKKKSPWTYGMGVALTPYSLVGYNVQTDSTFAELGAIKSTFQGTGGTYRFTWSNAVKYKQTAFGLNLGWQFGNATYENTTNFGDSLPTFDDTQRDKLHIRGFVWNVGVQHDFVLEHAENDVNTPTRWVTVGLTGESSHKLRVGAEQLFLRNRQLNANGSYANPDTLVYQPETQRDLVLPAAFGIGFQYVKANKWRLGAQYEFQNWANYRNDARPNTTFRNTSSLSAGLEYIRDATSYNNYARRIRLRLGAYYRQDPRVIGGENLDDVGLTLGFGFPLVLPRQQTSFINTAFEIGQLGQGSVISERYVRLTVGFTLNDNSWFYKRRFE